MFKSVNDIIAKQIILGGNFNLYFDSFLESQDGNPIFKNNSIAKLIELKRPFNFAIFGILKISETKDLLFDKIIGLALFNLDGIFLVSNVLQESIYKNKCLIFVL